MAQKPIASTLFRFVTTRNPQLLSKEERARGFIYFPSAQKSSSYFLNGIDEEGDNDSRRTYLESRATTYSNLPTRKSVENINNDLFDFSHWLMKNKNTITSSDASNKAAGVNELSSLQLLSLWDNLLYQVVSKKSDTVREAIIQVIVADNFLKKNDSQTTRSLIADDKDLQRLANAYVVIEKNVVTNSASRDNEEQSGKEKDFQILEDKLTVFETKKELEIYKAAAKELKEAIAVNDTKNSAAFEVAYAEYQEAEKEAYENATKVVDPLTQAVSYTGLVLPELNYESSSILAENYLTGRVSAETQTVVNVLIAEGVDEEEALLQRISDVSKDLNKVHYKAKRRKARTALYNGTIIKANVRPADHTYVAKAQTLKEDPNKFKVNLVIATGYESAAIESSNLSIRLGNGTQYNTVTILETQSDENTLVISLDEQTNGIFGSSDFLTLSGSITLDNGDVIDISSDMTIDGAKGKGMGNSQRLAQQLIEMPKHGINKMGVADFRKVDQEICCYVPGEVSRIENVLAKEYKERSTRQLLSSETTDETTTENEVENLTDTTTSERNELTSEVSSILNEDSSENYGASAGVNGGFGNLNFYADGFYNGGSASSSSNSNSTAQTYAEEVTERALERVVQKTTKKRTSRILREFEENNKHGFDNREGQNHVTGVYRWVDKIYNNKLINYGKRLVYEFNVPEPSRFFKEAILETVKGENIPSVSSIPGGLISPEMPDPIVDHVADASGIDRENYQWIAALYNAQVEAPPLEEMYIGHSFAYTVTEIGGNGEGLAERAAEKVDLDIPEGYAATKVRGTSYDSEDTHHNETKIIAGNREILPRRWGGFPPRLKFNGWNRIEPHVEKLPISFSQLGNISGNSTVSVKLELLPEGFQKWQNETYTAIANAYQERLQEYNDWLYANFEPSIPSAEDEQRRREFNPGLNRILEKRELKRLAVDMMARPFGIATARKGYGGSNSYPYLNNLLDKHASYVKFFEQCFDWEIMAYVFYPYFYGSRNEWKGLFAESNGTDPIFQAFLQSGMARMVVPVRPGFEEAVTYFLETGDVWMGNQMAIDSDDELYLSIAEELQSTEGVVEKEWETRVPTSLTIVQANSAPLDENGLPCCHNEDETLNLAHGTSIMMGKDQTPSL